MYDIIFYEDKNGYSEVYSLLKVMEKDSITNKQSRINRNKIIAYIDKLKISGTRIGEPITKHLERAIRCLNDYRERNQ